MSGPEIKRINNRHNSYFPPQLGTGLIFHFDDIESAVTAAEAAVKWLEMVDMATGHPILSVSGFDDDPRALDEIPEARAIVRTFTMNLQMHHIVRFGPAASIMLASIDKATRIDASDILLLPEVVKEVIQAGIPLAMQLIANTAARS